MKYLFATTLSFCILTSSVLPALAGGGAASPTITITPTRVQQGEPIKITVENVSTTAGASNSVKSIALDGKALGIFIWNGTTTALYGFDLKAKVGTSTIVATLVNGKTISKTIFLNERPHIEAPLGIPEKLGGNSTSSELILVSTLAQENAKLASLWSGTHAFWKEKFVFPIKNPIVTDDYGYSRQTGAVTISHKGTDFRAKEGTAVYAMNRGVVRMAEYTRNYGNTIVVDHGLGLQTMYMHLSKINVNVGQLVLPNPQIGLSGMTGYAESPHLHLTIRIGGVSIDAMKFMELFR